MKYKFLIVTEDYDVFGTNDEAKATAAAEYQQVYNVELGTQLSYTGDGREAIALEIKEWVE